MLNHGNMKLTMYIRRFYFMPSYVIINVDTLAPAGLSLVINSSAQYAASQQVSVALTTTDTSTTDYEMKFWGDVDATFSANVQPLEANSSWIPYSNPVTISLSTGDASKTIKAKLRDKVRNATSEVSASIILDTAAAVVNSGAPDRDVISMQSGCDSAAFTFTVNEAFKAYKVKVMPSENSLHDAGVQIPTTAGSSNVQGSAGNYPADTGITVTIKCSDLLVASSGNGAKIVKVFVQDMSDKWNSV
jgi:hypothetical protein